jgi:hypothetical protein
MFFLRRYPNLMNNAFPSPPAFAVPATLSHFYTFFPSASTTVIESFLRASPFVSTLPKRSMPREALVSSLQFTSATDCVAYALLGILDCDLSNRELLARLTLNGEKSSVGSIGRSSLLQCGERELLEGLLDLCQPTYSHLYSWEFKRVSYLAVGRWIVLSVED